MIELSDVYAERGIVGCALHGAISDELEPVWIADDSRRVLFLAADCLRHHGEWNVPQSDHPAHTLAASLANAERIAHAVVKANVWISGSDPRAELKRCMDGATLLALLPYFVARVRDRFLKLEAISDAERHLQEMVQEVQLVGRI